MPTLIPIKYHNRNYPADIQADIYELPCHMDVVSIPRTPFYSLHTEYSSAKRALDSYIIQKFPAIQGANVNGVPQLWSNESWADQFAGFIRTLIGDHRPPLFIEIHPPFRDYCPTVEQFCNVYGLFEARIASIYPETQILIKNRFGTRYRMGKFLTSSYLDVIELTRHLESTKLRLGIVLDVPQVIS